MKAAAILRFGDFEIDSNERTLRRHGTPIHLQPKAFDVLFAIAERNGGLVSRHQLFASVWHGVNVSDANLTNCIAALRSILGEQSVETVAKHGYRLKLEVTIPSTLSLHSAAHLEDAKVQMARRTSEAVGESQRLLWIVIAEDPSCAEAWAWLARASRYLEKFGVAPASNRRLAESAFRRTFQLDPDLSVAHQFFTAFQVDTGDAVEAMKRLLKRCAKFPNDVNSYVGLIQACRFAGLLDASLAAHQRASLLDPNVSSSVSHTHFVRCDYRATIAAHALEGRGVGGYLDLAAWACLGVEIQNELVKRLESGQWPPVLSALMKSLLLALRRDGAALKKLVNEHNLSEDPESALYFARNLAYCQCWKEAIELLRASIKGGFTVPPLFDHDPWLMPLHSHSAYQQLRSQASAAHRNARNVFSREQGGNFLNVG